MVILGVCNLSLYYQNNLCASGCFPTGKSPVSVWHSHSISGPLIHLCHTSTVSLCSEQILIYSHSQPPWYVTHLSLLPYQGVMLSLSPSSASLCHISQIWAAFNGKALTDYFSSSSPSPNPPAPYR